MDQKIEKYENSFLSYEKNHLFSLLFILYVSLKIISSKRKPFLKASFYLEEQKFTARS